MHYSNETKLALDMFIQQNPWILLALVWEVVWKAIALYKSARNRQQIWYGAILIINTVGILPIVYILFFQKDKNEHKK